MGTYGNSKGHRNVFFKNANRAQAIKYATFVNYTRKYFRWIAIPPLMYLMPLVMSNWLWDGFQYVEGLFMQQQNDF